MLMKRLLTALFLIPIFVVCVLYLTHFQFALLITAFSLLAGWEWTGLMGLKKTLSRGAYLIILIFATQASLFYIDLFSLLRITAVWWLFAALLVVTYPRTKILWSQRVWVKGLMGMFVLVPTWYSLVFLHAQSQAGVLQVLYLFVLIWGADSGAYFAGKFFGKHKLAPNVSPGKTWEGCMGAIVSTMMIAGLELYFDKPSQSLWKMGLLLAIVTVLFSILGDLFESMLKRDVGLKDSGNLIPGHGGLLDRIDSLTAAAPIFTFGCWLITMSAVS